MSHLLEGPWRAALTNSNFPLIVGSWPDAKIAPEPKSESQKGADRMKRIMILGGVLAALAVGIVAVAGAGAQEDTL